jgi:lactate racemase
MAVLPHLRYTNSILDFILPPCSYQCNCLTRRYPVSAYKLKFGSGTLSVNIPEGVHTDCFRLSADSSLADPTAAVIQALANPSDSPLLGRLAKGRKDACIVISDITRPIPNAVLLPPILEELENSGILRENILILIATGIHRPNEGEELDRLVGKKIARDYRVENHMARDSDSHLDLGKSADGVPLQIDRRYIDADLKILTGLIEPHLMAGYSGGRKAILPGLASVETMRHMHSFSMIQRDSSVYGLMDGNPFHRASLETARKVGADFIVNVAVSSSHELTAVFAGELEAAHLAGVEYVRKQHFVQVEQPYDIVVTSGGGAPLDNTLYQTGKGVVAALGVLKPGGCIVIASENAEGAGSGDFISIFEELSSHEDFFKKASQPDYFRIDQWMAQEFCNAAHHAQIFYHCSGIPSEELSKFFVTPVQSVSEGLEKAFVCSGDSPRVLVLPDGPYLIPELPSPAGDIYDWYYKKPV